MFFLILDTSISVERGFFFDLLYEKTKTILKVQLLSILCDLHWPFKQIGMGFENIEKLTKYLHCDEKSWFPIFFHEWKNEKYANQLFKSNIGAERNFFHGCRGKNECKSQLKKAKII